MHLRFGIELAKFALRLEANISITYLVIQRFSVLTASILATILNEEVAMTDTCFLAIWDID